MVPWLNKELDTEILAARFSHHRGAANRITVRDSCCTSHSPTCHLDRDVVTKYSRPQQLFEYH